MPILLLTKTHSKKDRYIKHCRRNEQTISIREQEIIIHYVMLKLPRKWKQCSSIVANECRETNSCKIYSRHYRPTCQQHRCRGHTFSYNLIHPIIYIMMYVLIYNPLYTFVDTYSYCYEHILDKHFDNYFVLYNRNIIL